MCPHVRFASDTFTKLVESLSEVTPHITQIRLTELPSDNQYHIYQPSTGTVPYLFDPRLEPQNVASRVKLLGTPERHVTTRPVASLHRCTANLQLAKLNFVGACGYCMTM